VDADEKKYIFADNTYSKPYFVTYINTSFFAISLIPIFLRIVHKHGMAHVKQSAIEFWQGRGNGYSGVGTQAGNSDEEAEDPLSASQTRLLVDDDDSGPALSMSGDPTPPEGGQLSVPETARLSLEFCFLWFIANYLVAACLEYTSVASSTILTSMSSVFTLIFGALLRVEAFSYKKLIGVLASLTGITLISLVDLSGKDNDENRGNFPHKSHTEIAIGDAMAFGSSVMYGIYAIVMKKRIGNEDRVSMPLFFGLVGLFNCMLLWPGFFILHFTGVEKFQMPPTSKIWIIVLVSLPCTPSFSPPMRLTLHQGEFSVILHIRLLLGLRHASHHPIGRSRRYKHDDPTLPHWTDDTQFSILECYVLGWCLHCTTLLPLCEPRE
jgi:solute carrier family 35 protein F5